MATSTYQVSGMSCQHCEEAVRTEVDAIDGVDEVEVSAEAGRLAVTTGGEIEDRTVIDAVEEAGYQAVRV